MPTIPKPLGASASRSELSDTLRREKVERIRRRVETGTYHVDLEALATRIVDDGGIR